jgi:hypothetical protein
MPGVATQLVICDLVRKRLSAAHPAQAEIADILNAEPAYAYLGAVGADLVDFMPNDLTPGLLGGTSAYLTFWRSVFGIASGTAGVPGLFPTLDKLTAFLTKLEKIAKDEDLDGLKSMKDNGEIDTALAVMGDLSTIVQNLPNLVLPLTTSITVGQKPLVNVPVGDTPPPPITWSCREVLHWKKPGTFVQALLNRAGNNPRFKAYAHGYAMSYAAKTCGAPHVNSITGGPYRLHWWRSRWLNNYGDAWAWGFYNASPRPTVDDSYSGYSSWKSLCNANLQTRIEIPGVVLNPDDLLKTVANSGALPAALPDDFAQFWMDAFNDAYGAPPMGSRFSKAGLNGAYVLTWLMLWFQTSGKVLGCNSAPPMVPPDTDCGDNPPWIDPATSPPGDGGGPSLPPQPEVESDPDVGKIICGVILALLGLAAAATGNLLAGGAAIAGGVDLIIAGASDINWEKLRCSLYWYRLYLYNGLKALHDGAVLVGIVHPYASELQNPTQSLQLLGFTFAFDSGPRTVKSRGGRDDYPASLWTGGAPDWTNRPTGLELDRTIAYLQVAFPDYWIDDANLNPLSNGQVRIGGQWPLKQLAGSERPAEFGNAIDNAIDVLIHRADPMPDWNLDADRGLAYLTWEFAGSYASPVNIKQES